MLWGVKNSIDCRKVNLKFKKINNMLGVKYAKKEIITK